MNKIILFLSSYIPLYILLIIKNILERITTEGEFVDDIINKVKNAGYFNEINDWAILILFIVSVASFFYLKCILKNSGGNKEYIVSEVADETGNVFFAYISIYFLSCIGLTLNSIVDCFVFAFVMLVVGYIYIDNNLMYMNPMIGILGYRVYVCRLNSVNTIDHNIKSIVVWPKNQNIKTGDCIRGTAKVGFVVAEKKMDA